MTRVSIKSYLGESCDELSQEIAFEDDASFKYFPVMYIDVDRTFSAYKLVLTDIRCLLQQSIWSKFTFEDELALN